MSATRILVLGVVRHFGHAHGYQVRRELLSWRADRWAKIAPGSIYQALRTLSKHHLLQAVATEAGTGGPERTVYRITDDGEAEFFDLVRRAVSDPDTGPESLAAAFAFLHLLTRGEVPNLLAYRVQTLSARIVEISPPLYDRVIEDGTPPQVGALGELYRTKLQAELDWSLELADQIREGAYVFANQV